ncbi:SWIM zinc finger family protein [Arcicella aquatica]|uniref:SWIM zinc finger family protein n=1 Tax=Arcicella aquatica TaxID=217141 RepID=A0ABU5QMM1_9BACT|nr:SWIM zinc finger family protein [Arcicella aquatica]MEA5258170.1 SWIM zinc finger family protein [Arcicella aquatica]
MNFSEQQVETLAPDTASLKAGKALSNANQWLIKQFNERVLWGEIKGSGSKPYRTQIDLQNIAYKCSCPSFKFPCKHGIGLMLAFAKQPTLFSETNSEPDWVKEWIDKRNLKAEKKVEVSPETSLDTEEKAQKSKEKRQNERLLQVEGGIVELELWLKDLVRTGLLALPNKDASFFEKIAARMVDAKATGLAGRVRAFRDLNYLGNDDWQKDSLRIAAEIFLLIEAFKNSSKLSLEWQQSLKSLVGWNQSPKELLQNPNAEKVKDVWIALGQEQQESEGIIIQRNWLLGAKTNRSALILNFGTPYSPLDNIVLPGALIEAELVFFPSVLPHRAVINLQKGFVQKLDKIPEMFNDWTDAFQFRAEQLSKYPFVNDIPMVINNLRFVLDKKQHILCDATMHFHEISHSWTEEKMLTLYAYAGNTSVNLAGIFRRDGFLPLGIFEGDNYLML